MRRALLVFTVVLVFIAGVAIGQTNAVTISLSRQAAEELHGALSLALGSTTTTQVTTTEAPTTTQIVTTTTTLPPTTTTTQVPTTTAPPTTTTTISTSCQGVQVAAGANLVTVANSQPAGTTFCLAAGQFNLTGTGMPLQNGDKVIGALGTSGQRLSVIDGGDSATLAFTCTCSGGELRNLIIEDFAMAIQQGPTGPALTNWLYANLESRFNSSDGIHVHNGSRVDGGYFHHNGEIGVGGQGDNAIVENAEIAFNGSATASGRDGGSKWVNVVNLIVRNNHVHDNLGPGLWTDGSNASTNVNTLYENNNVHDNTGEGIFHEISGTATIQGNTVICNAGAGEIYIANSRGTSTQPILVRDNIVGTHCNPNVGSLVAKDDPNRHVRLGFVRFENNQVTAESRLTGVFGTNPIVAPGIEFVSNDYFSNLYGSSGNGWRWGDSFLTWQHWQALGFDTTGTRQLA